MAKTAGKGFDTGAKIIADKLVSLPAGSGVYRMLDENGKVLYVGKAKNLKKRVANYTHPDKLSDRIRLMVSLTKDLIVVTTASESEAFLLENQFIKTLKPYFNILLKDDKTFPHILITAESYPRILKHRGAKKIKGEYYGPFAGVQSVNETIKTLRKAFLLRTCSDAEFKNRSRPCMLYQIKQCSAPCKDFISLEDYGESVKEAKDFLKGKSVDIQNKLSAEMNNLSRNREYEKAAFVRDRLKALYSIQNQGYIDIPPYLKLDILAVHNDGQQAAVQAFFIRSGFSFGSYTAFYSGLDEGASSDEVLENFIGQFYDKDNLPDEIVINILLKSAGNIAKALNVKINTAPKGSRSKLLRDAAANAVGALQRKKILETVDKKVYAELAGLVGLTADNLKKIEVYDNSHISGTNAVGVMIAADKEGFKKSSYRRFAIKAENYTAGDDLSMMKEVLSRRLNSVKKEALPPSLMIIDGGEGQVKAVLWAMYKSELTLSDIKVIGIAKGEKHDGGDETLIIPLDSNGTLCKRVRLGKSSPLLFYIERLRDEAHRFAIGSHRSKRQRESFKNPLDSIEGIGSKRKKALLEHFGSAKAVSTASLSEIAKVEGISSVVAAKVYAFFHTE